MTTRGTLRHHFGGSEYVATVLFYLNTEAERDQLLAQLPKGLRTSMGRTARGNPAVVVGPLTPDQVKVLKAWLEPLRTDPPCTLFDCAPRHRRFGRTYGRHAIDGCEHSIDYGPDFELELPYVDLATPELPFDPIIHVRVGD